MLSIGDPFPDLELTDHRGEAWRPSDVGSRPLVMIVHRHLA